MLLDVGCKINSVVTLKLTSGEEIIATLVEEHADYIKVGKPRVLVNAGQGIGMSSYLITADPDKYVKMNRNTVVVLEPTDKEFATQYTQNTTGLITL